ncbi:MAG: hypothetical protein IJ088_07925 [Clostridia bacterium]|nr:hypothetical protein [Clostridia bacterium]
MSLPSSFVIYDDKVTRPFITMRELYITFSKQAVEMLGYAEYVHLFLDKANKKIAFQACKKDKLSIPFYKEPEEGKQMLVRLNGKERVTAIMEIAGIRDCGKGIRIYGDFLPEDKAMVFDLNEI